MQMMWIHISVVHKLSGTVLPGRAAGSPSSCRSPLLGRTQILCSAELHAVCRQTGNWDFASICMKIAAKICYHLINQRKTGYFVGWVRWQSVEMRLHGSVQTG